MKETISIILSIFNIFLMVIVLFLVVGTTGIKGWEGLAVNDNTMTISVTEKKPSVVALTVSNSYQGQRDYIIGLYQRLLLRVPREDEVDSWIDSGKNKDQIRREMVDSDEFASKNVELIKVKR